MEEGNVSPKGDVLQALLLMEAKLLDPETAAEERLTALRLLSHFAGDSHQPLHVGRKTDLGGNTIQVKWFGDETFESVAIELAPEPREPCGENGAYVHPATGECVVREVSHPKVNLHKVWDLLMIQRWLEKGRLRGRRERLRVQAQGLRNRRHRRGERVGASSRRERYVLGVGLGVAGTPRPGVRRRPGPPARALLPAQRKDRAGAGRPRRLSPGRDAQPNLRPPRAQCGRRGDRSRAPRASGAGGEPCGRVVSSAYPDRTRGTESDGDGRDACDDAGQRDLPRIEILGRRYPDPGQGRFAARRSWPATMARKAATSQR